MYRFFSASLIWFIKLFKKRVYINDDIYNLEFLERYYPYKKISCIRSHSLVFDSAKYDLAIIIPCYNAEKFIKECANSVLSQKTKYKLQIIFVDDGSTDNTGKILDDVSKTSRNVFVIHQKNKGLSGARNEGIKQSLSDYITFIDSDDYLMQPYIFDSLITQIKSLSLNINDRAIISYGISKTLLKNQRKTKARNLKLKECNPLSLTGFACAKVYSRDLFSKICFPEECWFEDSINSLCLFHLANKLFYLNDTAYFYRQHNESITQSSLFDHKVLDTFYITLSLMEDIAKLKLDSKYIGPSLMRQIACNYKRLKPFGEEINKSVFIETKKLLLKYSISKNVGLKYHYIFKAFVKGDYSLYKIACTIIR